MDDPSTSSITEGFGLMFYQSRFYDPQISRFTQADSIVPGGLQGLDRYAYVANNPIKYTDPSGHNEECAVGEAGCNAGVYTPPPDQTGSLDRVLADWGITEGDGDGGPLTREEKWAILRAAYDIGRKFAEVRGGTPREAFVAVFVYGVVVIKSSQTCQEARNDNCWAYTEGTTITIYSNANVSNSSAFRGMFIHEMGHVFDNTMGLSLSQGYRDRIRRMEEDGWTPMPTGCDGIRNVHEGDCSDDPYYIEQAADMFLAWVDGDFDTDLAGTRRANWSNLWIGSFVLNGAGPSDYGTNCNEDTGEGCEPQ